MRRRAFTASALCTFVAPTLAAPALAQPQWPTKPLRLVIPYPPGGPSDVSSRIVMERAAQLLGHGVLFDNKAGASGMIGAEFVKNQPVDHHTFLTTTTAMVCITRHLQPIPFDPDTRHRPGVAHDDLVGRLRRPSLGAGQHGRRSSWPMRRPIRAS